MRPSAQWQHGGARRVLLTLLCNGVLRQSSQDLLDLFAQLLLRGLCGRHLGGRIWSLRGRRWRWLVEESSAAAGSGANDKRDEQNDRRQAWSGGAFPFAHARFLRFLRVAERSGAKPLL